MLWSFDRSLAKTSNLGLRVAILLIFCPFYYCYASSKVLSCLLSGIFYCKQPAFSVIFSSLHCIIKIYYVLTRCDWNILQILHQFVRACVFIVGSDCKDTQHSR